MFPRWFRHLSLGVALAFGALGAMLFFAPGWSSGAFAWKVSPFVAMTIGAWCLGNAWAAYVVAQSERSAVLSVALYLGLFGVLETGVAVAFRDKLLLDRPLAWLYFLALAGSCALAAWLALLWTRQRPLARRVGAPMRAWDITIIWGFLAFVGFIAYYALTAVQGDRGLNATVFPEVLSMFSLRSFGAFYLSLAAAVIPLLVARGLGNFAQHNYGLYPLLLAILAAALVFIDRFHFAEHPKQWLYVGAYVVVGIGSGIYLWRYAAQRAAR